MLLQQKNRESVANIVSIFEFTRIEDWKIGRLEDWKKIKRFEDKEIRRLKKI
jgi:hypothetical protein